MRAPNLSLTPNTNLISQPINDQFSNNLPSNSSHTPPISISKPEPQPLQSRKPCKCGRFDHQRTSHKSCPENKLNRNKLSLIVILNLKANFALFLLKSLISKNNEVEIFMEDTYINSNINNNSELTSTKLVFIIK